MFPHFDSWALADLRGHQAAVSQFMFWGAVVYGLLTVIAGGYVTSYNNRLTEAVESAQINLNAEKDKARDDAIAAANEKLAPRTLSKEAANALTHALSSEIPKVPLEILVVATDSDTQNFADSLVAIFRAAGWSIVSDKRDGIIWPQVVGLQIGMAENDNSVRASHGQLAEALRNLGIPPVTAGWHPQIEKGRLRLVIGPKDQ